MKNTISLNKNEQFLLVYRKGKRAYHKFFTLYYLPNGKAYNRLGFQVGKKLAKAVKRNRLRRLLKESYRLSESRIKSGYDFILAAREGSLCINTQEEIAKITDRLFYRAGLLCDVAKEEIG